MFQKTSILQKIVLLQIHQKYVKMRKNQHNAPRVPSLSQSGSLPSSSRTHFSRRRALSSLLSGGTSGRPDPSVNTKKAVLPPESPFCGRAAQAPTGQPKSPLVLHIHAKPGGLRLISFSQSGKTPWDYSPNRPVERYRSPVSGRSTTMRLPAFSSRFAT